MGSYQILCLVLAFLWLLTCVLFLVYWAKKRAGTGKPYPPMAKSQEREDESCSSLLLDTMLDHIWHGAMILNQDKEIIKINESLANLFYLDRWSILGKKTINIFNNNRLEDLVSVALADEKPVKEQIIFYGEQELYLDIEAFALKLLPETGKQGLTAKQSNRYVIILARNNTQEIEFSKLRSQFVANISHEMRTPLTSIKGYMETMLDDDFKDEHRIKGYLDKSLKEVERLSFLIEDVLNLSRIEYKRNVLLKEEVNIGEAIEEVIGSLEYLARQNEVDINFDYSGPPLYFFTDEHLFRQMIKNLTENSIFHAGKKSTLTIEVKPGPQGVNLEFSDDGRGIDKEDLPFIFQRFYKGKGKSISSGLGLSIVKHIVELHQGKIEVESEPRHKTSFKVFLPSKWRNELK
ncbi:MAG: HAMP domain-containing sensor histidine kinase [Actinomycetota bacterium]|nr:HAMP domain-containing sensor histidine kinase [Actinomycetota bacterium]